MFISDLRPEDRLLICIGRRRLDESTAQLICDLANRPGFDWKYVLAAASFHRLIALLAHHLESIDGEVVPQPFRLRLQTENTENTERCLWLTGELAKLAAAMHDAGIDWIPFKGPTLAITAYEDPGLRQFTDLDLFVREGDVARMKELLSKEGFRPARNLSRAREAALLRFDNACAFVNEQDVLLDVHWRFAPRYLSLQLETDDLWSRLQKVNLGNQLLYTLSPEDLLLVLCCHGFSHQWERLAWICDVATLIDRDNGLDWDYFFRKAGRLGVLRIALLGLLLARDLLGASLPPQASDKLESETDVKKSAEEVAAQLFAPDTPHEASPRWLGPQLKMRERSRDRIKSLLAILLIPRDYDWMFTSIPDSFGFLYYLIRPIRMARAYGLRILNRSSARN
jgi:putative nucleotidyltransferase-like protein